MVIWQKSAHPQHLGIHLEVCYELCLKLNGKVATEKKNKKCNFLFLSFCQDNLPDPLLPIEKCAVLLNGRPKRDARPTHTAHKTRGQRTGGRGGGRPHYWRAIIASPQPPTEHTLLIKRQKPERECFEGFVLCERVLGVSELKSKGWNKIRLRSTRLEKDDRT